MAEDKRPHIDAVSGQAAFMLVQTLALRLVREGVLPKKTLQDDVAKAASFCRKAPNLTPAQQAAAHLLGQVHTLLHTADKSDAN